MEKDLSTLIFSPVIEVCNFFIPKMVEKGYGRIINMTSGIKDQPELSPYSVSRRAVDKYTLDISAELKGSNVIISYLDPGWLRTDLGSQNAPNPVGSSLRRHSAGPDRGFRTERAKIQHSGFQTPVSNLKKREASIMRKFLLISPVLLIFCFSLANALDTNSATNDLLRETDNSKIIIPDIKLSIEDESKVPLANQKESILQGHPSNDVGIDIEELTKSKESDKFKSEMTKERSSGDFSLSDFKVYYGTYNNIIAEINTGKKSDNLNYIFTYLRNMRDNTGYQGAAYFNTSLNIDDFNGDIIYSVNSNIDITGSFGYYDRSIGLYTNISNVNETKKDVPFSLGALYQIGMNSISKRKDFMIISI